MNFKKNHRHTIDVLFVFILFGLFTFSAIILIMIGADIYEKTVQNMEYNFNDRTSVSYITEKIRAFDENGNISVDTINNKPALLLSEYIDNIEYVTYLYFYNDSICELFTRKDLEMSPESGRSIMAAKSFNIVSINCNLYSFSIKSENNKELTFYVSTHSTPITQSENVED